MIDQPTDPATAPDEAVDARSETKQEPQSQPDEVEASTPDESSTPAEAPPAAPAAEVAAAPDAVSEVAEEAASASDESTPKADKASKAPPPKRRKITAQASALYRAFRSRRPISARVEKVIKGGFELSVGKSRGFCPHSQMEIGHIDDPEKFVGQSLLFRVTQVRRGGADVVLSRRALLEAERLDESKAVKATLVEGALMLGRIAGVAPFGAFVELGAGVQGLVHVSEVSHGRVTDPAELLKVGQPVTVKILKIDDKRGRISLSIRQAQADPWVKAAENFETGKTYKGKVQRLADFGIFVELAEGLEGLAPASELPPSRGGWREALTVGEEREWLVLSCDPSQHRVSLTIPVEGFDLETAKAIEVGNTVKGRVQRVERFGVFVWLAPGRVGLMPNVFTGTRPGTDLSRTFAAEDEIVVEVVEIGEEGRRIRLAVPGAREKVEEVRRAPKKPRRQEARAPRDPRPTFTASDDTEGAFGMSLADKLKAALKGQQTPRP